MDRAGDDMRADDVLFNDLQMLCCHFPFDILACRRSGRVNMLGDEGPSGN
jgi:hypothetical protein